MRLQIRLEVFPVKAIFIHALLLCVLLLLIQIPPWLLFGVDTVKRLYPLIVHLPLTLGLIFLLHKPLGVSIVSVFTAYLCCEILNWVREIVSALTHSVLAGEISYAVLLVPVFLLLRLALPLNG